MDIILSHTDSAPIYEQIEQQIRRGILGGALQPGDALPSMRLLAKELRISVITTKRAYEELEREGLIVTQTGRGSFVAALDGARLQQERRSQVEAPLREAARRAREGGLSPQAFLALAAQMMEEEA